MALQTRKPNIERAYTPEEFEALPQFDELYELVDGKLVKKPLPGDAHGRIGKRIDRKLAAFDPDENLGMNCRCLSQRTNSTSTKVNYRRRIER